MNTKRKLLIAGIVIGSLLTLAPVFGLLGTVLGMMHSFQTLGNAGISDPHALSSGIATTLLSTAVGLFLCPIGVLILTPSLILFFRLQASNPPPLPSEQME